MNESQRIWGTNTMHLRKTQVDIGDKVFSRKIKN